MKKIAFAAALAATVGALSAGPAGANPPNDATIAGGCFASDVTDTINRTRSIVVSGVAAAHSPTAGHNPVTLIDFKCTIQRTADGTDLITYDGLTAGPVGVVTTQRYGIALTESVEVCVDWRTVDAHLQVNTGGSCSPTSTQEVPPPLVKNLLCDITRAVAPIQLNAVLLIDTSGDVYVLGSRVLDCYPYA